MNGKQLKNSILQWAIQGKLVPQDPNDEPASVLLERIREEKARLVKEKKIKKDKNESIIYRGDDNSHYEKFADGTVKCIDDEIPFEIPQSWCWTRISNITQSYIGLTYSPSDVSSQGTIVLRSSNIKNGKLDLCDIVRVSKEIPEKLRVSPNDIIICARNGSKRLVGKSAIVDTVNEPMTFGAFMAICKTPFYKYIYQFLQSDLFFSQLRDVSGTTTINQLTQNNFNAFLVPIPPIDEQQRIVEKIAEIMPIADKYEKSQEALDRLNTEIFNKLKKSVLQEAIQGRLVPQDPNDEPASVLLERIKAEKAKLFKEGKLKKKDLVDSVIFKGEDNKYYEKVGSEINCIDDEIPFEIPSNWQWVRLGKVTIVNPRNTISDEMSVGFIPMTNISPGYGNSIECEQRYWKDVKSGFTHIADGDVAFAKITPCFQNRKSFIAANLPNGFAAGTTELNVLRPYDNTIDTRYLLWFLKSEYFISEAKFKGTAGQQRVVTDYVLNRLCPLPPVKEQIRISNHLEFVIASITRR